MEKLEKARVVSRFHPFPACEYPRRIMQTLECTDSKTQCDMMLLAVITVLGAMIGRLLRFKHSHRFWYPALQAFAVGTAASGKSGITLARRLSDLQNVERGVYAFTNAVASRARVRVCVRIPLKVESLKV